MGEKPGSPTACRRQCCRGQPVKAKNPVEGAKAAEARATPAEYLAPARHGGDDASDIPGATPPT
eukprot:2564563-Pyramimonas_sp.AAC.1